MIQVRDVPPEVANTLKAQAAEQGMTLTAFLRREFERIAARPSNATIIERMARRNRLDGPSSADIVAEIRRLRDAS